MSGVVVVYTGWFNLTESIPGQTAHMKRLTVIMFVDTVSVIENKCNM